MYLERKTKNSKSGKVTSHIWNDVAQDTECLMYSSGGMDKNNYKLVYSLNNKLCVMCETNKKNKHKA